MPKDLRRDPPDDWIVIVQSIQCSPDRSRILRSSIMVTLDGGERRVRFDELTRELVVDLSSGELSGTHELVIHHQNMLKNSNWPQRYQLRAQGERVSVEQLGARRPRRQPATRPVVKP